MDNCTKSKKLYKDGITRLHSCKYCEGFRHTWVYFAVWFVLVICHTVHELV